ncbi:hypothetical protein PCL1606_30050 [Pseudomonas chlororaphis]|uniref:Uncharacterized protein n=1 Tax=Pseudomonas chlororaphis TaxID=587753 RepID=A0A0D5XZF6_9PSED|nr:hypothetical protein PCL1606_30050 [Pseudomonas chlororaphis]
MPTGKALYPWAFKELQRASRVLQNAVDVRQLLRSEQLPPAERHGLAPLRAISDPAYP